MLKFFKKIRQKLLAEGKLKSYTFYAIGEIFLVVVGILIALQINEWNADRKDRKAEFELLSNLKSEFLENQKSLDTTLAHHTKSVEGIRNLLSHFGPDSEAIVPEKFTELIQSVIYLPSYQPSDGVLNSVLSSNQFALIEDVELRSHLTRWPSLIKEYEGAFSFLREHSLRADAAMHPFFSPRNMEVSLGRGSVGPSRFETNQQALFQNQAFEAIVELMRLNTEGLLNRAHALEAYQKDLFAMINRNLENSD
ncbi:hypothetical protein VDG1235_3185 [Verrucomicrobiia bacterium DG1235]|nr:hypothetical protein VDG1235_3185 [Verrucomicrobiae bacterium DG1235]